MLILRNSWESYLLTPSRRGGGIVSEELRNLINRILYEATTIKLLTEDKQILKIADRILGAGEEIFKQEYTA